MITSNAPSAVFEQAALTSSGKCYLAFTETDKGTQSKVNLQIDADLVPALIEQLSRVVEARCQLQQEELIELQARCDGLESRLAGLDR
jgi:hypothetical protein